MNHEQAFSLTLPRDLPPEERLALLTIAGKSNEIREERGQGFVPEWEVFIAVAKDVGTVATATTAAIRLAREIISWRAECRNRDIRPRVMLKRPRKPVLNLEIATDEEIMDWFAEESKAR
jgi:hypothetical protein